jgi:hypothetical protein
LLTIPRALNHQAGDIGEKPVRIACVAMDETRNHSHIRKRNHADSERQRADNRSLARAAEFDASGLREPPKWLDKASTVRKTMSGQRPQCPADSPIKPQAWIGDCVKRRFTNSPGGDAIGSYEMCLPVRPPLSPTAIAGMADLSEARWSSPSSNGDGRSGVSL